jgi:hypothetical protein
MIGLELVGHMSWQVNLIERAYYNLIKKLQSIPIQCVNGIEYFWLLIQSNNTAVSKGGASF